jgi:hypothetical protein
VDAPQFPFVPKSTSLLRRGQFWSLPLDRGLYGAGCVVGTHLRERKPSTRSFIAGVVRWVGTKPPNSEDLRDCALVKFGYAHIKSITTTGGEILGFAEIKFGSAPEASDDYFLESWGYNIVRLAAQRLAREHPALYVRIAHGADGNAG